MSEGLGIRVLFDSKYTQLVQRYSTREFKFERTPDSDEKIATSEIANDSDWHRTRIGLMCYNGAGLFSLEGRMWAIAQGIKGGSYPGEIYLGDIIALDLVSDGKSEDDLKKELCERISV